MCEKKLSTVQLTSISGHCANKSLLFKSIFSKYDACSLMPEDDEVPILRAQSHQEARAGEGDRSCRQEPGAGDVLVEEVRHDGHQDR